MFHAGAHLQQTIEEYANASASMISSKEAGLAALEAEKAALQAKAKALTAAVTDLHMVHFLLEHLNIALIELCGLYLAGVMLLCLNAFEQ